MKISYWNLLGQGCYDDDHVAVYKLHKNSTSLNENKLHLWGLMHMNIKGERLKSIGMFCTKL